MLKSYFENNKVPTFGGGAIGRRQQEAFWNAVGAAQQSQTGGTAPVDPEMQSMAQSFATYQTAPPTAQSIGRASALQHADPTHAV